MTDYEAVLEGSIAEVKEYVDSNDVDVEALLAAEREGKDRKTLKQWLKSEADTSVQNTAGEGDVPQSAAAGAGSAAADDNNIHLSFTPLQGVVAAFVVGILFGGFVMAAAGGSFTGLMTAPSQDDGGDSGPQPVQDAIKQMASDEGGDADAIQSCIDSQNPMDEVNSDKQEGAGFDVTISTPQGDQRFVGGTPSFVIYADGASEGVPLVGAQPYARFEQTIDGLLAGDDVLGDQQGAQVSHMDLEGEPVFGEDDAPVTLVMYEDYQCPFCKRFETQTFPQLASNYVDSGQLRVVWKDFPAPSLGHDWAEPAAAAMECVYRESGDDVFWSVKQKLFERAKTLTRGSDTFSAG